MQRGRLSLVTGLVCLGCAAVALCLPRSAQAQNGIVAWWPGNGNYNDIVGGHNGTPYGGVSFTRGRYGPAFDFDGSTGRIFIPDSSAFELTASLAISAWIWIRSLPPVTGQIFFRGDDRGGYDPYFLQVTGPYNNLGGGNLSFAINDIYNNYVTVLAPVPIGKWVFVVGTLNSDGQMLLLEDGRVVDQLWTNIRPLGQLDPSYSPGLGIGNVQSSNYTEYFDGIIDDVKLYNTATPVVTPASISVKPSTIKGGNTAIGTVVLTDSSFTPVVVSLKSTNPAASVPTSITIPAGSYSKAFRIDTSAVTSNKTGAISATYNGVTVSANITVTP